MTTSRRRARGAAVLATALGAALAACGDDGGDGGGGGGDGDSLTVWIIEDLPDRVRATEAIMADFTEASGVEVTMRAVAEDQFAQLLTSSAAAGDLPDVIGGISLPQVRTMSANELIDTEAVAGVMEGLGEDTFSPEAIELVLDLLARARGGPA